MIFEKKPVVAVDTGI